MKLGEVGFKPRTVIEAVDHVRSFRNRSLKSISKKISINPKSGYFKGMKITQWEKLNLWPDIVAGELRKWEEGGRSATGKRNPPTLASKTKNWAADISEGLFGYSANSSRKKDLGFLELKTFGVIEKDNRWDVIERFLPLTAFSWQEVHDQSFEYSKIKQKIMQQLWIPIIKNPDGLGEKATVEGIGDFRIGPPIIWIPTEDESISMADDYERVREELRNGRHENASAKFFSSKNKLIVPNTAGSNKKEKTSYRTKDGKIHQGVKRRKWNLKNECVREVFLLHWDK